MDPFSLFMGMFSGIGKMMQGEAGYRAGQIDARIAESNAEVARLNREMARMDANLAYTTGSLKTSRVAKAVRAAHGAATAHFAANNLDPAYGSPLAIQLHAAEQGEADKKLIEAQSRMDASNNLSRAASASGQVASSLYAAAAARDRAEQSRMAGMLGVGTSFLRGIGRWSGLSDRASGGDYTSYGGFDFGGAWGG
jgi:hypothetical protein